MKILITIIVTLLLLFGLSVGAVSVFLSIWNLSGSSNFVISEAPNVDGIKVGAYGSIIALIFFFVSYHILNWTSGTYGINNNIRIKVTLFFISLLGIFSMIICGWIPVKYLDLMTLTGSQQAIHTFFYLTFT